MIPAAALGAKSVQGLSRLQALQNRCTTISFLARLAFLMSLPSFVTAALEHGLQCPYSFADSSTES